MILQLPLTLSSGPPSKEPALAKKSFWPASELLRLPAGTFPATVSVDSVLWNQASWGAAEVRTRTTGMRYRLSKYSLLSSAQHWLGRTMENQGKNYSCSLWVHQPEGLRGFSVKIKTVVFLSTSCCWSVPVSHQMFSSYFWESPRSILDECIINKSLASMWWQPFFCFFLSVTAGMATSLAVPALHAEGECLSSGSCWKGWSCPHVMSTNQCGRCHCCKASGVVMCSHPTAGWSGDCRARAAVPGRRDADTHRWSSVLALRFLRQEESSSCLWAAFCVHVYPQVVQLDAPNFSRRVCLYILPV